MYGKAKKVMEGFLHGVLFLRSDKNDPVGCHLIHWQSDQPGLGGLTERFIEGSKTVKSAFPISLHRPYQLARRSGGDFGPGTFPVLHVQEKLPGRVLQRSNATMCGPMVRAVIGVPLPFQIESVACSLHPDAECG